MTGSGGRPAAFTLLVLVVFVGVQRLAATDGPRPAAACAMAAAEAQERAGLAVRERRAAGRATAISRTVASHRRPACRARCPRSFAWPPPRAPGSVRSTVPTRSARQRAVA